MTEKISKSAVLGRPFKRGGSFTVPLELLGHIELPGVAESISRARRYVQNVLRAAGQEDTHDAVLLVSELVSNAFKYSRSARRGGWITVDVFDCGGEFQIEVIDAGSAGCAPPSTPIVPQQEREGGRGLWLVGQIARSWGWYDGFGRVVWFRVAKG